MEWIVVSFVVIVFWLVLEALALKRVAVKLARVTDLQIRSCAIVAATALTVAAQEHERKERLADEVAATIERAKRGGPPEVEDFDVKKGGVL